MKFSEYMKKNKGWLDGFDAGFKAALEEWAKTEIQSTRIACKIKIKKIMFNFYKRESQLDDIKIRKANNK